MDSITLAIFTAISAGVHDVVTGELVEQITPDLYTALKTLIKQKYGEDCNLNDAIESLEKGHQSPLDPESLEEKVILAKANQDSEILKMAQNLLTALEAQKNTDPSAIAQGFGAIDVGVKSVFIGGNATDNIIVTGDHNTVKKTNIDIHLEYLKSLPATAPSPLGYFVGREKTRNEIKAMITKDSQSIVVALLGMGGIGKTSLVKQIAYDLKDEFPDNVFWGDLNEVAGDSNRILRTWGAYCGREFPEKLSENELAEQVRGLLTERRKSSGSVLVIIDDLRQDWMDSGIILLNAIPESIPILMTSREIDSVRLKASKIIALDKDPFSNSEACDMLIVRSDHQLDFNQSKIVAGLCEKMPLALELSAQVANAEGAKYLLDKLSDATKRLETLKVGSRARKDASVKITFEISYNSLPVDAATAFRYLGAFASVSITASHLSDVFAQSGEKIDSDEALRLLKRYSLLQNSRDDGDASYRMHALLHSYSKTLLKGDEATKACYGHFICFRNFAQAYANVDLSERNNKATEFEIFYPQMIQALANFEQEYNLKNPGFNSNKQSKLTIEFVDILDKYWTLHDSFDDQVKWLGVAYDVSRVIKLPLKQADFARRIGRIKGWQGELEDGFQWMQECEATLGNQKNRQANAIRALMYIHRASLKYQKGALETAEQDCMLGVEIVTKKGQPRIYAEGYNLLGAIKLATRKLSAAREAFEKSLSAWKQVGDQYQISRVRDNVRVPLYYLGNIADLRDEEGLQYWQQFPDRIEYAAALTNRGLVHYIDQEHEIAVELHKHAMEISDLLGFPRLRAIIRCNLAWPYISLGKYDQAQALLNESLKIQEEYDFMEYAIDAKRCLAEVEIGRKNYPKAVEIAETAMKLARKERDPLELGAALRVLGQAYHLNGNLKQAGVCLKKSLPLLRDNEYNYESYLTLQALADYYADMGVTKQAQATLAEAQTLAKEMGLRQNRIWHNENKVD